MQVKLSLPVIYTIILVEGFVTISLEILSIRQLVPFVGNSVVTTSIIIGVFLLFLALGYQKGGRIQENYATRLIHNFLIAGLLIGIGLSFPMLEVYFRFISLVMKDNLLFILTTYLLVILAPSIYLLGQTVPITMHLKNTDGSAGQIGGHVLYLSTIGSFLGAVLTSLVCMRYLGVAQTVFFNYLCLLTLIGILVIKSKEHTFVLLLSIIAAIPVFMMNVSFEKIHFVKTTNYANYQLINTDKYYGTEGKVLVINHSNSSYINEAGLGFPYLEKIKTIFEDLKFEGQDILVLGAGGFVLGVQDSKNHYTYVDIDDALPGIVKDNDFIDKINGEIIIKDARQYLLTSNIKYDAIVLDAYSHKRAVPFHLTTQAFFELVKTHLKADGIMVSNVIMEPLQMSEFGQNIDNTIRSVFKHCSQMPLHFKRESTNNIYVCQGKENSDSQIYVDNSNENEFDIFDQS